MRKLIFLLAILPSMLLAQNKDSLMIRTLSNEILQNGKAYDLLYQLTKQIGGRLAGSPGMVKAEIWGQRTLEQLGADQVWMQECMVPHWVRGGKDKAVITEINNKKANRALDVLALGNSLGSGGKTITAEVITVANFDELEKRKNEIKGKIVYYNNAFNPTNIQPFVSYGEAGIYRRSGPSRAAKYGAVAVMIRSLTESVANDPHTGGMAYTDSLPKIPAVAVGPRDADYLWHLKKGFKVSLSTNGKFLPDTIGHNVIAELKGSEFPNEFITIGGHLDSWDVNEGAHDDGAGIVHTMEILRAMKAIGYKPKHSIRFVLFANEENGLRGGTKYAEVAKQLNEKHLFALESDEGGFTPRGFGFTTQNKAQLAKLQSWLPLLKPYGTETIIDGGGGADIGPLNRTFGTVLSGFVPDAQRYFDVHHARSDVFENVHKRELLLGAVNMAGLVYLVDQYGL
ncbi:MAG: peptidase M28 family protein [Bacteroidetes bacterium 24-39-8]|nr:MAG: peptidase M28 family protein [Sphingobacteriia bacterium 35-40-8]OYZ51350.1 MAG: peptidase M28 family protein [Bacteroidetes bacterium 24-39-8]OZA64647.1 MAG: peptidase M28 family protein [Sphingobacteriia bacterium 39-39-8]HQR93057.1 M20/M25/M40 family metallo-hydrolase [Sediminibacterium sp.]HQS55528.1 M20/M25/M40 family metallo-hydrolase [Sediminibacterium sp.]